MEPQCLTEVAGLGGVMDEDAVVSPLLFPSGTVLRAATPACLHAASVLAGEVRGDTWAGLDHRPCLALLGVSLLLDHLEGVEGGVPAELPLLYPGGTVLGAATPTCLHAPSVIAGVVSGNHWAGLDHSLALFALLLDHLEGSASLPREAGLVHLELGPGDPGDGAGSVRP